MKVIVCFFYCLVSLFICLFVCILITLRFYVPVIPDDERGPGRERNGLVVCLCVRGKWILRGDKFDDYLVRNCVFLGYG